LPGATERLEFLGFMKSGGRMTAHPSPNPLALLFLRQPIGEINVVKLNSKSFFANGHKSMI